MTPEEGRLLQQLDRCRVPHYTYPFEFRHSGRGYWVVKGPIPIKVAWELYDDPAADHIRVAGHCGCPPPEAPWIELHMPDGTQLLTMKDKADLELAISKNILSDNQDHTKQFTFSDHPDVRAKAKEYVMMYHIDSEVGLRVFVDYLRKYNLFK